MTKKNTSFFKEQTRIPLKLKIEKTWCRQKRTIEQFLQTSVHTDNRSTKETIFQQKIQNQSIRGQITFGIQLQTFPSKGNRKLQSRTWNTAEKKTHSNNGGNKNQSIQWIKREAVTSFLHLCLNDIWAPGQWHVCISKTSRFFLVFAGQKQISGTHRATNK